MLKMVDGTGIIGVDMVCPLGGAVSPPQPPNYDKVEMEGVGRLMLPNSLKAPLERLELIGNSMKGENPAPDNPQEIKSAGRKSKNLFDINYFKDKSNLKMLQCEGFTLLGIICNVKPNTEYTLSANLSEAKYNLNIANKATRFSLTSSPTRTLISNDDGTLYIGFYGATADNVNMDDFMQQYQNIQLEERTVATDYEPCGYLLDVKVTGKNLFNLTDNYIWGWFAGYQTQISLHSVNAVVYMPCKPNTTYTIYGRTNINGNNNVKNRVATANDFPAGGTKLHNITETQLSNPVTITTDELSKYLVIMAVTDNECNIDTREQVLKQNASKMMVIIGNTPTPYQPYTEQSIQIVLNEPLRGIGEYKDVLTKDGVVRKIKRVVLDGSEGWLIDKIVDGNVTQTFVLILKDMLLISNHDKRIMCDKFKFGTALWANDIVAIGTYSNKLYLNVEKDKVPDLQTFKTWLSQNPLAVDYVLAEPVTEPLPESEQQQLQALHSENGTTHVFVDSGEVPCGIKLTYRKEK